MIGISNHEETLAERVGGPFQTIRYPPYPRLRHGLYYLVCLVRLLWRAKYEAPQYTRLYNQLQSSQAPPWNMHSV